MPQRSLGNKTQTQHIIRDPKKTTYNLKFLIILCLCLLKHSPGAYAVYFFPQLYKIGISFPNLNHMPVYIAEAKQPASVANIYCILHYRQHPDVGMLPGNQDVKKLSTVSAVV